MNKISAEICGVFSHIWLYMAAQTSPASSHFALKADATDLTCRKPSRRTPNTVVSAISVTPKSHSTFRGSDEFTSKIPSQITPSHFAPFEYFDYLQTQVKYTELKILYRFNILYYIRIRIINYLISLINLIGLPGRRWR